jgi:two-component system, NtrC family, C4-dicarboxylate transport response regulator DctD
MTSVIKTSPKRFNAAYGQFRFRTLLVDEDLSDVRYYFGVLHTLGHDVVVSGSYPEALSMLEQGNFDMVIVAQGGPSFEGRPVVAKAREINPDMPVLVVARTLDIECYLEAMEMGAVDYLERCAAPRDFMRSVDNHLQIKAAA